MSKFWMIAHGSVQIFMLDKVTADIQGEKKMYFNRSRLKEKSAETMSEFTKHDDRTAKDKTQYKEMKSDHRGNHRGNETRWQSKK